MGKRIPSWLLCLFFALSGTLYGQFSEGPTEIREGIFHIAWDFTLKDLGTYSAPETGLRTTFRFRNLGPSPLAIEGVFPTCSCTIPEYPQASIPPGESASIDVLLDHHQPGPFSKLVKVRFVGMKETILLALEGTIQ
jgi:hypothetical protein